MDQLLRPQTTAAIQPLIIACRPARVVILTLKCLLNYVDHVCSSLNAVIVELQDTDM